MADPFSIIGLIGVAAQIIQVGVQFGLDWNDAPKVVRNLTQELQALIIILSETNKKIISNPDFAAADEEGLPNTGVNSRLSELNLPIIKRELEDVLLELSSRARDSRIGWKRIKETFLARKTKETIEALHRQCQALNNLVVIDAAVVTANIHRRIVDAAAKQHARESTTKEKKILDWLMCISVDFSAQQKDLIRRRQPGTGQWFLSSVEHQEWLQSTSKNTLFCPGIPGAGKTIITAGVIDNLTTGFCDDKTVGVAYIYCNFKRSDELGVEDLLLSLLRQLCRKAPVNGAVKDLRKNCRKKNTHPTINEISSALDSIISSLSKVFLVVDALDECRALDGCRSRFLSEIFALQTRHAVKIFATSRFIDEIISDFNGSTVKEIRAIDEDLYKYLRNRITLSGSTVLKAHTDEIVAHITKRAGGMFLLAQLDFDAIRTKKTLKKLRDSLHDVPTGPKAYDEAYKNAMERITDQDNDSKELAYKTLTWITRAKRHLTILELQHALAVEVGDTKIEEENLPQVEDILSSCTGLVTIEEKSNIVRLVHYTAQEYLERSGQEWFPQGEYELSRTCLTYLLFEVFSSGPCQSDDTFMERIGSNPLYNYAAHNWGHHVRVASSSCCEVLKFLDLKPNREASVQAFMVPIRWTQHPGFSQKFTTRMGAFHLAAYFGISDVMKKLVFKENPCGRDGYGRSPLSYAVEKGHIDAARELLMYGAKFELETVCPYGHNTLMYAVENGDEDMLRLLLEHGAKAETADSSGITPLQSVAGTGRDALVKLLLQYGADPNPTNEFSGLSPLSLACLLGHPTTAKLLIGHGAKLNLSNRSDDAYPLASAIAGGSHAIVKLLLENGADLEPTNSYGHTPLILAALKADDALVKLLLEHGADARIKSHTGKTSLAWASFKGYTNVVTLLLEKDGDLAISKDSIGRMPLVFAAKNGHSDVVNTLLTSDNVDPHAPDYYGLTALSVAAVHGNLEIMEMLINAGSADISIQDRFGRGLLWWARRGGNQDIVQLLLNEAERKGIILHDGYAVEYDTPSSVSDPLRMVVAVCDVCTMDISDDGSAFYHCAVCNRGDFDICGQCYEDFGARCLMNDHSLQRRRRLKRTYT